MSNPTNSTPTTRIIGPTAPPSLQDILNSVTSQNSANTHCVKVGTISTYNAALNTAEVTINSQVELTDGRVFDYPLLVDCPVFRLQGGSAYITMPILPGDEVLIVFNDFDIDNWWYSGDTGLPESGRKHSLADGFVLAGVNSVPNAIPALSSIVEIYAGANKVAIGNAVYSLKYLMDSFLTVLSGATVQVAAATWPFTAATIAQLATLKTEFDLLLDKGSSPL